MKKISVLILFFVILYSASHAQISGSSIVCPGYVYDYNINVSGATSYNWSVPAGWIIISGQGTSQLSVLCNTSIDSICVNAFNSTGTLLSKSCYNVEWGGGIGWDAAVANVLPCLCDPVAISVTPNSSGCPGSCGSGVQSAHTFFAVYNNSWPSGTYLGPADGIETYPLGPIGSLTHIYVYQVDTSLGLNNAVLITGGACSPVVNGGVTLVGCSNLILSPVTTPDTVCVGDTFSISGNTYGNSPFGFNWTTSDPNITFLSGPPFTDHISGVLTGYINTPIQIQYWVMDVNGCSYYGHAYVIPDLCSSLPVPGFTSATSMGCPGTCISFTNQTISGSDYQWSFPGGIPATDTSVHPQNICYLYPGEYDVTLVASNPNGSDTLTTHHYVTIHPVNASPITWSGDTLFAGSNYSSYQWYEDSTVIPGATDHFYVLQHSGNYGVTVADSNGCEGTSFLFGIMVSKNELLQKKDFFSIHYQNQTLKIDYGGYTTGEASLEIADMSGKIIYFDKIILNKSETYFPLSLTPGVYVAAIRMKDSFLSGKFIVKP